MLFSCDIIAYVYDVLISSCAVNNSFSPYLLFLTVVHKLLISFCCITSHTSSEHFTQLLKIYTPYDGVNLWLNVHEYANFG